MTSADRALVAFERLFGPEFGHGKAFDLGRLRAALAALGAPHHRLPPAIHVAGTNGKGSAIAFMRAIAQSAGLRVHAFTKPHLLRLNERFVVAGAPAADDALIVAAKRIAAVDAGLTQFDAQVGAAFLLFSETSADLTIIETGMGGLTDSTNVLEDPALTLITPIGLDHQDALGATLAEVARHKAGILKPGVPAVVARQPRDAMAVIEARAQEIGAPLWRQGVEWDAFSHSGRLVVQAESEAFDLPTPALAGAHQIDNAGAAVAALLRAGFAIPAPCFAMGVENARLPARLQPLTRGRLSAEIRAQGGEVWLDAGHNADGARVLAQALTAMQTRRPAQRIVIVGLRARKDAPAFISALTPALDNLIAVPLSEAHVAPHDLVALAREQGLAAASAASLQHAMEHAAQFPATRALICGSFLLAAEALAAENG